MHVLSFKMSKVNTAVCITRSKPYHCKAADLKPNTVEPEVACACASVSYKQQLFVTVNQTINKISKPASPVMSSWHGYLLLSCSVHLHAQNAALNAEQS